MKVKQEKQQRSAASGVRRPTTTASFVQLQQSRWEWKLVGMKVKLPGTVWGIYAQNEETREWARVYAKQQFEVIVRNVVTADQDKDPTLEGAPADAAAAEGGSATYLWIVQHNKEEPFTIRAPDLLPYVRGKQRQELLALGAPVPEPVKKTEKVPASRRKKSSENMPIKKQEATAAAAVDDIVAYSAEKTAGNVAAHGANPPEPEKAQHRRPTRARRPRAGAARASTIDPAGATKASKTGDTAGAESQRKERGDAENQLTNEFAQMPGTFVCDWGNEVAGLNVDAASAAGGEYPQPSANRETKNTHADWMSWDPGAGGSRHHANGRADTVGSEQLILQDAAAQSTLQDQRATNGVNGDRGARNLLFALHMKVKDDVRLNLRVFEGDIPEVLARQIATRYNLGKGQETFIAGAILSQAEAVERQAQGLQGKEGLPPPSTLTRFPPGGLDATDRHAHEVEKLNPMYSSGGIPFHSLGQGAPTNRFPTEMQQVDQGHQRRRRRRPGDQNGQPGKKLKPDQSGPKTETGASQKPCPVRLRWL